MWRILWSFNALLNISLLKCLVFISNFLPLISAIKVWLNHSVKSHNQQGLWNWWWNIGLVWIAPVQLAYNMMSQIATSRHSSLVNPCTRPAGIAINVYHPPSGPRLTVWKDGFMVIFWPMIDLDSFAHNNANRDLLLMTHGRDSKGTLTSFVCYCSFIWSLSVRSRAHIH